MRLKNTFTVSVGKRKHLVTRYSRQCGKRRYIYVIIYDHNLFPLHRRRFPNYTRLKIILQWIEQKLGTQIVNDPEPEYPDKQFYYRGKLFTVLGGVLYTGDELQECQHIPPQLAKHAVKFGYEGKYKSLKTK